MEDDGRYEVSAPRRDRGAVTVRVDHVEVTADGVLGLRGRATGTVHASRTGELHVAAVSPGRRRMASAGRYRLDRDGSLVATVRPPTTSSRWSWLRWSTDGVALRFARVPRVALPGGYLRVVAGTVIVGSLWTPEVARAHLVRVDPATDGTLRIVLRSTGAPLEWATLRGRRGPGEVGATVERGAAGDLVAVFAETAFATTVRRRYDLVAGWGDTEAEFDPPPGTYAARAFPYRAVVDREQPAVKHRVHRAGDGHVSLDVVPAGRSSP